MFAAATDRDLEMMAWLAERDMEAVAHAHAQFVAATEPDDVASLGRTYQRVSRCLRSTLALKMKAAEAAGNREARAKIIGARDDFVRDRAVEARTIHPLRAPFALSTPRSPAGWRRLRRAVPLSRSAGKERTTPTVRNGSSSEI